MAHGLSPLLSRIGHNSDLFWRAMEPNAPASGVPGYHQLSDKCVLSSPRLKEQGTEQRTVAGRVVRIGLIQ